VKKIFNCVAPLQLPKLLGAPLRSAPIPKKYLELRSAPLRSSLKKNIWSSAPLRSIPKKVFGAPLRSAPVQNKFSELRSAPLQSKIISWSSAPLRSKRKKNGPAPLRSLPGAERSGANLHHWPFLTSHWVVTTWWFLLASFYHTIHINCAKFELSSSLAISYIQKSRYFDFLVLRKRMV